LGDPEFGAAKAPLKVEPKDGSIGGSNAIAMLSDVALSASMSAIAVFFPLFQHLGHGEFRFSPAKFMRQPRFATGHASGIKAGIERDDRLADEGDWHASTYSDFPRNRIKLAITPAYRKSIQSPIGKEERDSVNVSS
jgi:hypothetical protein